ncbi:hypothetical protein HK101_004094 [Irineochytrium annulatum]|nr:hypothetical protein HK101_004094 [Irineochytrium annulatum]
MSTAGEAHQHHADHDASGGAAACHCHIKPTPYTQSMEEMVQLPFPCFAEPPADILLLQQDWDRSIWAHAHAGRADKVARWLATNSARVDDMDGSGFTPLHYAARQGRVRVCDALIRAGATVDLPTEGLGATALYRAVLGAHEEVAGLLLAEGANAGLKMKDGRTKPSIVTLLLQKAGVHVNALDAKGLSPLDLCHSGAVEKVLLAVGARRGAEVRARAAARRAASPMRGDNDAGATDGGIAANPGSTEVAAEVAGIVVGAEGMGP